MKTPVILKINICSECPFIEPNGWHHSGQVTAICGHKNAVECAIQKKHVNKKDPTDRYHPRHRKIRKPKTIPEWCPLRKEEGN
jgi:hypothetical protein